MTPSGVKLYLQQCEALTSLGTSAQTHSALMAGRKGLTLLPVGGQRGGDLVPLGMWEGRPLDETVVPSWECASQRWKELVGGPSWGSARRPVIVTSSNFGVGSQYAFRCGGGERAHLGHGAPARCLERLTQGMGWGPLVMSLSHACVSATLGLSQARAWLQRDLADEVLVFSFDFLSPFVTGGFHALKILNGQWPSPFCEGETGSIALGDGMGFAVVSREPSRFELASVSLYNEMHHFTANRADGEGFRQVLAGLGGVATGRNVWLKGHGTGTLDSGRLEVAALSEAFPGAPLVGWKGALGHTLGSCGLVELAVVCRALELGEVPGTVGGQGPAMGPSVQLEPWSIQGPQAVVCLSNAFGGAHAGLVLAYD